MDVHIDYSVDTIEDPAIAYRKKGGNGIII